MPIDFIKSLILLLVSNVRKNMILQEFEWDALTLVVSELQNFFSCT
jgi:hypothetical protein